MVSATTATPVGTSTTFFTPGMAMAFAASKRATFPPSTGGRATAAWSMPGMRTSMPKVAAPRVLAGVSSRGTGLPMSV